MNTEHLNEYCCDYYHTDEVSFYAAVNDLITQLRGEKNIMRLVIFGEVPESDYESQVEYVKDKIAEAFTCEAKRVPLVTYVAQPVLGKGTYAAEVHYFRNTPIKLTITSKFFEDVNYFIVDSADRSSLLIEGIKSDFSDSLKDQSDDVFRKLEAILQNEDFAIDDIIRQWNYIGRITDMQDGIQNYQAFNDSRTIFYNKATWKRHGYPAATGIGMDCGGVIVEVIATKHKNAALHIEPVDNPLQVAAHKYSDQVLVGKNDERLSGLSTPKFERAKAVSSEYGYTCFVSGTAAIRGEDSLTGKDCCAQTDLTMENIEALISAENLRCSGLNISKVSAMNSARVYVKNPEEYNHTRSRVDHRWSDVRALYLKADVCREELLVEIEGMASCRF